MKNISREEKIETLRKGFHTPEKLDLLQDDILDDLYLKYLIDNNLITKEEAGKEWVTNYNGDASLILDPNKSLYQNYIEANKDNNDGVAIYDFNNDRILRHGEVKDLVNAFANGLSTLGIGQKSKVGVIINGCYEEPMCLFSPNKLGARVKYLDYFKGPLSIRNDVVNRNLNILFIDEMFLPMEPFINEKNVPVVVLNPTKDYSNTKYLTFDDVLKRSSSASVNAIDMNPDEPAIEINSSGTTGGPKPIVHTNFSSNIAAQKMIFSGFPLERGNFTLKAIPSQIGLGSLTTLYTSLVSGTGVILIRPETKEVAFKNTVDILKNYKTIMKKYGLDEESLLMIFASPMFIRSIHSEINNIDDMSHVGGFLAAGSKMSKKELEVMDSDFMSKGCKVPVTNAYGQNEQAGAVSLNTPKHNKPGSAGFPVIGTDVVIVDPKTGKVLKEKGSIGRILVNSASLFKYYDGLEEETKESRVMLDDGSIWFNTKDLGYIDKDGFVWITGRESRVITRSDFKISLDTIQDKLYSLGIFKELAVVSRFSQDGTDEEPILFCELNNKNLTLEEIEPLIESVLGPYERPVIIRFLDQLPSLPSGKVDYPKLNSLVEQLPSVEDPKSLKLKFSVDKNTDK